MKFSKRSIKIDNLKIPENKITLIRGLSGSGKSTLLYKFALISKENDYEYCIMTYNKDTKYLIILEFKY